MKELNDLQTSLDVSTDRLAPMLGLSKATVHRQKRAGSKLNPAVGDRVVPSPGTRQRHPCFWRHRGLSAKQWLNSPQFGLGGAIPLEYAQLKLALARSRTYWAASNTESILDTHRVAYCVRKTSADGIRWRSQALRRPMELCLCPDGLCRRTPIARRPRTSGHIDKTKMECASSALPSNLTNA